VSQGDNIHHQLVVKNIVDNAVIATTTWTLSSSDALKNYAYYYRYDIRGNCIEKKLPGADPQYLVYDHADRLILSQDALQRAKDRWIFFKYDIQGRMVMRGSVVLTSSHASLIESYKDVTIVESYTGNTGNFGYSQTYIAGTYTPYEVIFYDNYTYLSNSNIIPGTRSGYCKQHSEVQ